MTPAALAKIRERAERPCIWSEGEVPRHVAEYLWDAVHDRQSLLDAEAWKAQDTLAVASLRRLREALPDECEVLLSGRSVCRRHRTAQRGSATPDQARHEAEAWIPEGRADPVRGDRVIVGPAPCSVCGLPVSWVRASGGLGWRHPSGRFTCPVPSEPRLPSELAEMIESTSHVISAATLFRQALEYSRQVEAEQRRVSEPDPDDEPPLAAVLPRSY